MSLGTGVTIPSYFSALELPTSTKFNKLVGSYVTLINDYTNHQHLSTINSGGYYIQAGSQTNDSEAAVPIATAILTLTPPIPGGVSAYMISQVSGLRLQSLESGKSIYFNTTLSGTNRYDRMELKNTGDLCLYDIHNNPSSPDTKLIFTPPVYAGTLAARITSTGNLDIYVGTSTNILNLTTTALIVNGTLNTALSPLATAYITTANITTLVVANTVTTLGVTTLGATTISATTLSVTGGGSSATVTNATITNATITNLTTTNLNLTTLSVGSPITGALVLTPASAICPFTINQTKDGVDGQIINQSGTYFGLTINNSGTGAINGGIYISDSSVSTHGLLYLNSTGASDYPVGIIIKQQTLSGNGTRYISFRHGDDVEGGSITRSTSYGTMYNTGSDRRVKENIIDTKYNLNDLMKLNVRDFSLISSPGVVATGLIAQETIDIYPGCVSKPKDDNEMMSIDYGKLTPLLIKAVQDLAKKVEALENK